MSLIQPMFAMVVLTGIVLLQMGRSRYRAVRSGDVKISYFKTYESSIALPDYVLKPSRHFSNLFEAPVLFYVACLVAMQIDRQGPAVLGLAWAYVVARYAHAFIHLGRNDVMLRMRIYVIGWIILMAMWIVLII